MMAARNITRRVKHIIDQVIRRFEGKEEATGMYLMSTLL